MKWLQICKEIFISSTQEEPLSVFELEENLNDQIDQGNISKVRRSLKMIGRSLSAKERVTLIESCRVKHKFAEAFYLTRELPSDAHKKNLLRSISREAAFADDYSTARAAALLYENIHA